MKKTTLTLHLKSLFHQMFKPIFWNHKCISPKVSSAADSELTSQVLEMPEFISHPAQLFPEVPTDLNNASSFDMEFSIDALSLTQQWR
jgi:hypothetical protein